MRTIFYSVKGGQGCSVAAITAALTLGRTEPVDLVGQGVDHRNILGLPGQYHADGECHNKPEHLTGLNADVTLWHGDGPEECRPVRRQVIDAGNISGRGLHDFGDGIPEERILVMRNDYLALSAAVQSAVKPDGVLLIEEDHRALTRVDVSNVIGSRVPLFAIPVSPVVARAVDAGLFAHRQPPNMVRAIEALVVQFIPDPMEV